MVDQFIAAVAQVPTELFLDFARPGDRGHGKQAGRFCHGHYCFLPLQVFCGAPLLGFLCGQQLGQGPACVGDAQVVGPAVAPGLAASKDRGAGGQRLVPVAEAARVRRTTR